MHKVDVIFRGLPDLAALFNFMQTFSSFAGLMYNREWRWGFERHGIGGAGNRGR